MRGVAHDLERLLGVGDVVAVVGHVGVQVLREAAHGQLFDRPVEVVVHLRELGRHEVAGAVGAHDLVLVGHGVVLPGTDEGADGHGFREFAQGVGVGMDAAGVFPVLAGGGAQGHDAAQPHEPLGKGGGLGLAQAAHAVAPAAGTMV